MATMEVGAKAPKVEKNWAGTIEVPDTAAEMINSYGDQAVKDNAWANFKITIQSAIRRMLEAGKSDDEIQTTVSAMKMGVSLPRAGGGMTVTTAKNKLLGAWSEMTDEERKAFMAALKAANKEPSAVSPPGGSLRWVAFFWCL